MILFRLQPAASAASLNFVFNYWQVLSTNSGLPSTQSLKMNLISGILVALSHSVIFFIAQTAICNTFATLQLTSPLMFIISRLEIDIQNIANLLSYLGSSRSMEKIPSLSRIITLGNSGQSVVKSIALRPFVHLPALTANFAPNK